MKSTTIHPDDIAVDNFAAAMKQKLAAARAKGRGGWQQADAETLSCTLVAHLGKGNAGTFEDVANFAMMLHQNKADPAVLVNMFKSAITSVSGAFNEADKKSRQLMAYKLGECQKVINHIAVAVGCENDPMSCWELVDALVSQDKGGEL